jgi:hypothetical protein
MMARSCLLLLFLLLLSGCTYKVVRPQPLTIGSPETGGVRIIHYPAHIVVHDSHSAWDAHQLKDNIMGVRDLELVRVVDFGLGAVTPDERPTETGIEWIKNRYAQLPDCAAVRIVDGLFSALGLEKLPIGDPSDPLTYFAVTRVVYLTDWLQETVGEFNTLGGYVNPWSDALVPHVATQPLNTGMDWLQAGAIAGYVQIFRYLNIGADYVIDAGESAWGGVVWCFVPLSPAE